MLLSVLLVAASCFLQFSHCRRLLDDMDNDIGAAPGGGGGGSVYSPQIEWVKISMPPKPVISKAVGSYVELECEAMGSPVPSLRWLKGRNTLTENQSYETNMISETPSQGLAKIRSRIVINYLLPVHGGRFTCLAEGGSQVATADTTIFVVDKEGYQRNFTQLVNTKILGAHYPPRVTLYATTYMDVIGTNVILPCQTIGNPKPTLTWIDPQGQVVGSNGGRVTVLPDGELSIRSLSWSDMGVYNCVAHNVVGRDSIETFLYPMKESK